MRRSGRAMVLGVVMVGALAAPGAAQSLSGRVTVDGTGLPLAEASVTIVEREGERVGSVVTDSTGSWRVGGLSVGTVYRVRVQKLGYAIVETQPFVLDSEPVVVDLRTRPEVAMLEGVSVQALNYEGFLRRRERRMGRTLAPADVRRRIERIRPRDTSRFLLGLLPNLSVDWRGAVWVRGCPASYMIDGTLYYARPAPWPTVDIDALVDPWEIRAVEIHQDSQFIPTELRVRFSADRPPCGLVVIWTFHGVGWEPE